MQGLKLTKEVLTNIGSDVASLWGAYLVGYEVKEKEVIFYCNEHGENFYTRISYDEILKDYKNFLK